MTNEDNKHIPVLLKESISFLNINERGIYVDCNLGHGGHTYEILKKGARVIAFELDNKAIEVSTLKLKKFIKEKQLIIINDNFKNIDVALKSNEVNQIDGVLYDLGLNMSQIKESQRGFSFEDNTKLDMRLDQSMGVTAEDLIRASSENELSRIIKTYGEEKHHKAYAKAIKKYVNENSEVNASDLAAIIKELNFSKGSKIHPATKTFQALRIVVNSELENLSESLSKVIPILKSSGRIVIISFHSLEDKISKQLKESPLLRTITVDPIEPSDEEIQNNISSRSAKLRCYEKY